MTNSRFYSLLTIFVLTLAIIQAPLLYYYTFGLFAFFIVIPYLIVGLGLTVWLLIVVLKSKKSEIVRFQKLGVILTISIGSLTLFLGEETIEKLDWWFRRNSRQEIIELVKAGRLKPNVTHNHIICTLEDWNIPPISNGGNEIAIYKTDDNRLTVEFYINRGFLDHYSAFVYTNDKEKIQELDERTALNTGLNVNKKLEENWYRVSY